MANEWKKRALESGIEELNLRIEELRNDRKVLESDGGTDCQQLRSSIEGEIKTLVHQKNIAVLMLKLEEDIPAMRALRSTRPHGSRVETPDSLLTDRRSLRLR
jgi:hypothetical protein